MSKEGVRMRGSLMVSSGGPLVRTPSARRQAARRRIAAAGSVLLLGLAGSVVGYLTGPSAEQEPTGPFSYFPSE
jgi:hypothetical protein